VLVGKPRGSLEAFAKITDSYLRADVRSDAISLGSGMKTCRAIKAIAVKQCHRGHLCIYCGTD
jgi:hypothetical protein